MKSEPVLLIIFNRIELTKQVMLTLEKVKPKRIFIAADGPRKYIDGEEKICEEVRRIATSIKWVCETNTHFRKENLGLGKSMAEAISWFFSQVSEGIILEDDCIPHPSFFRFCAELLEYYRDEPRVMHISGDNFQYGRKRGAYSYYFSKYAHCWGWASWRRAWKYFDYDIGPMKEKATTWAIQWSLSIERQGGVAVLPNVNLVSNIGFGEDATHTKEIERYSNLAGEEMDFPLKHPRKIKINKRADRYTKYTHFQGVRHENFICFYYTFDTLLKIKSKIYNFIKKYM